MAAADARLPRCRRLQAAAEYAAVFEHRRVLRGEWFNLHFGPTGDESRLGLVIPKKFARLSVARNLLKRIGREAYRCARAELPPRILVVRLARQLTMAERSGEARRRWRADIEALLARVPR